MEMHSSTTVTFPTPNAANSTNSSLIDMLLQYCLMLLKKHQNHQQQAQCHDTAQECMTSQHALVRPLTHQGIERNVTSESFPSQLSGYSSSPLHCDSAPTCVASSNSGSLSPDLYSLQKCVDDSIDGTMNDRTLVSSLAPSPFPVMLPTESSPSSFSNSIKPTASSLAVTLSFPFSASSTAASSALTSFLLSSASCSSDTSALGSPVRRPGGLVKYSSGVATIVRHNRNVAKVLLRSSQQKQVPSMIGVGIICKSKNEEELLQTSPSKRRKCGDSTRCS